MSNDLIDDKNKKKQYEIGAPAVVELPPTLSEIMDLLVNKSRVSSLTLSNDLNFRYEQSARTVHQIYSHLVETFQTAQYVAQKLTESPHWYMGEVLEGVMFDSDQRISINLGHKTFFGVKIEHSFDDIKKQPMRTNRKYNGGIELKLVVDDCDSVFYGSGELSIEQSAQRGFKAHTSNLRDINMCIDEIYGPLISKAYEATLDGKITIGQETRKFNVNFYDDKVPAITPLVISNLLVSLFAYADEEIIPSDKNTGMVETGGGLARGIELITRKLQLPLKKD